MKKILSLFSILFSATLLSQTGVTKNPYNDEYDVSHYGLIANGSTDNSNALNNLLSFAPVGSTIIFPRTVTGGTYNVAATTSLTNKYFRFVSHGAEIHVTGNFPAFWMSSTSNTLLAASKNSFTGFKFTGTSTGTLQSALYFYQDASMFNVANCRFENFGGAAIQAYIINAQAGAGGIITDCFFKADNIGVDLQLAAEYVNILNNHFTGCTLAIQSIAGNGFIIGNNINRGTAGIKWTAGSNDGHGIISNNNINHMSTNALELTGLTQGMTISDNHSYSANWAISTCTGITISGGELDVSSYTFNTNSRIVFNDVTLIGTSGGQVITGTAPTYINCRNLAGNLMTCPASSCALSSTVGIYTNGAIQVNDGSAAAGKIMVCTNTLGVGTWSAVASGGGVALNAYEIAYGNNTSVTSNKYFTRDSVSGQVIVGNKFTGVIGNYNLDTKSMFCIARTTDTADGSNAHGFVDATIFRKTTSPLAYNSYRSNVKFNDGKTHDHYSYSEIAAIITNSTTVGSVYGMYNSLTIDAGSSASRYGAYFLDYSGSGSSPYQTGLYIATLSKATQNFAIDIVSNDIRTGGNLRFVTAGSSAGSLTPRINFYHASSFNTAYITCRLNANSSEVIVNVAPSSLSPTREVVTWNADDGSGTGTGVSTMKLDAKIKILTNTNTNPQDGDLWFDAALGHFFGRVGGVTKQLDN